MKNIFTASLLLITSCLAAQTTQITYKKKQINHKAACAEQTGAVMLKGAISFNDLLNAPAYYWMKSGVDKYMPDEMAIKDMERTMWDYSIVVFMGTGDTGSQNLVPKLYKVMQEANMPQIVTMYATGRDNTTGTGIENKHFVSNAATIIVYDGGKEIGRITDKVKISLEYHLADIALKHESRKHIDWGIYDHPVPNLFEWVCSNSIYKYGL